MRLSLLTARGGFDRCCLCGSTKSLTGEHKLKASILRDIFGQQQMMFGGRTPRLKLTQSTNSKNLHFKARVCQSCNSSKTQAADKEFDDFYNYIKILDSNVNVLGDVFVGDYVRDLLKFAPHRYLNLFRYFAKIMCCQIVDAGGPSFRTLGRFATGRSDRNRIRLIVCDSPDFEQFRNVDCRWASHGGLHFYQDDYGNITEFVTYIDLRNLRLLFELSLHPLERWEIKKWDPQFYSNRKLIGLQ